jgi:hypothetical protein
MKAHTPETATPSVECSVSPYGALLTSYMIPRFRDFVTIRWACPSSQRTPAASSFPAIVMEDVDKALLVTGSEIGEVFKTELLRHVTRYAILSQSGIIAVKLYGVLCQLRLVGQFSPGESKG